MDIIAGGRPPYPLQRAEPQEARLHPPSAGISTHPLLVAPRHPFRLLRGPEGGIESNDVRDLSPLNFGLVVAYLVPGFVVLWGLSYHSETVRSWLAAAPATAPTAGGLLYGTLASIACGMTVSALRWAIIDTIHHHTGIPPPTWDFSRLHDRLAAYQTLVEQHYNYFQFYANTLVALTLTYVARRLGTAAPANQWGWGDAAFGVVCVVLFLGSRDALRKYYRRAGELLKPR